MGIGDAAKDAIGKAKEAAGDALNDPKMERQGEIDQTDAKIGKVADGVKDKIDDVKRGLQH